MGTRLYPITNNTSILETLAGVPQGTSIKLEQLYQLKKDMRGDEWYDMMDNHPEATALYDFQLFGFGKLNSAQWDIAKQICGEDDMYCGRTNDTESTTAMLNELDVFWKSRLGLINISDLEGVSWS